MKISKILKTAEQIQERVQKIGETLTDTFKDKEPVVIGVLNGSFIFYADLIRYISLDISCEFLGVSSYKNEKVSSGEVRLTFDLTKPIQDKDVILIEDIVDTGLTMNFLKDLLQTRKPRSLTTVSFLVKPDALKVPCKVDHIGFEIPNEFVVGYGLDYAGEYRNLPYLAVLEE